MSFVFGVGWGGGGWACQGISDPNVIGFTWFLSLELTNLMTRKDEGVNTKERLELDQWTKTYDVTIQIPKEHQ